MSQESTASMKLAAEYVETLKKLNIAGQSPPLLQPSVIRHCSSSTLQPTPQPKP